MKNTGHFKVRKVEPRFRTFIEENMIGRDFDMEKLIPLSKEKRVFTYQTQPNFIEKVLMENYHKLLSEKNAESKKKKKLRKIETQVEPKVENHNESELSFNESIALDMITNICEQRGVDIKSVIGKHGNRKIVDTRNFICYNLCEVEKIPIDSLTKILDRSKQQIKYCINTYIHNLKKDKKSISTKLKATKPMEEIDKELEEGVDTDKLIELIGKRLSLLNNEKKILLDFLKLERQSIQKQIEVIDIRKKQLEIINKLENTHNGNGLETYS